MKAVSFIIISVQIAFLLIILASVDVQSQTSSVNASDSAGIFIDYETVVAGKDYKIGGISEIILGEHWRQLWTKPFSVGVLDLGKYGGGLKAYKTGGGLQTKSLHFRGNDGRRYKFRSLDKDPRTVLIPELRNSIVADAFKDQISSSHPYSSVIASRLLDEIGVLNSKPVVTVLPDDPSLGEFRSIFRNMLGTIEETPTGEKDGRPGFAGADKIVDTYELYELLEKDNDNQVDAKEYLKARLFDILVGDWDRHYDQWLWAGYRKDGKTVYKPVPRDRDQAFSLYDGLLPMVAGRAITQIEGYSANYPPMYDLTFSGRYIDRKFLPELDYYAYDSLAKFIQSRLTDEVIDEAVRLMPVEWYSAGLTPLKKLIIARRDKLATITSEYYELINEVADVYGTNKNEEVRIDCRGDVMQVEIFKRKKNGELEGAPYFSRSFFPDFTNEIRIYLNEGNDNVKISGTTSPNGESFYYFPIDVRLIYDKGKKEITNKDAAFLEVTKDVRSKTNKQERFEPKVEDRSYDWRFFPVLNYNSDDGLVLGGGPIVYHYDYNIKPYDYKITFGGGYAFGSKGFTVLARGEFYSPIKGLCFKPDFLLTQIAIKRFFGLGNETAYDKQKDKDGYFNVDQNLVKFEVGLEKDFSKAINAGLTPFLKAAKTYYNPGTFLETIPDIYGLGKISFFGVNGRVTYDTRSSDNYPMRGLYLNAYGNFTPNIMKNNYGFGKAGVDLRAYYCRDTTRGVVFAFRGLAGKVWGTYPFYEALFLGGANSLKGYGRERFAGDGLVMAQSEIRMPVAMVNILVPGIFGVSVYGGVGRVFYEGEDSKVWHEAYGGSVWVSYLMRAYNFELSFGKSYEGWTFSVGTAFFL